MMALLECTVIARLSRNDSKIQAKIGILGNFRYEGRDLLKAEFAIE